MCERRAERLLTVTTGSRGERFAAATPATVVRRPPHSTVISGDVAGEVSRLKAGVSGDILVAGSGNLEKTLAEHDLVDEYRLMVFPIVLGTGKRLFADGVASTDLRLVDCKPVGADGVVILTYEPKR